MNEIVREKNRQRRLGSIIGWVGIATLVAVLAWEFYP